MSGKMEKFGLWLSQTFATTKAKKKEWPFVPGTYFVVDKDKPVAITTLGSVKFAEELSRLGCPGANIIGKVETENVGLEKIIRNIVSNPAIRFLLLVGDEPPMHLTGESLKCIFSNGVDPITKKIIGSPSMRPILPTITEEELFRFTAQIELVDMIGCKDVMAIREKVAELNARSPHAFDGDEIEIFAKVENIPVVYETYHDPQKIKLDKAGYFVIAIEGEEIVCEHYNYKDVLIRNIRGKTARDMYLTMVDNGWISRIDHACYIGKELTKAELSIVHGFEYIQDGA